jgi:hypothetical protein
MPLDDTIGNSTTIDARESPGDVLKRANAAQPQPPATPDSEENPHLAAAQEAMRKMEEAAPKPEATPPEQQWSSAAMALAALGGLLTHTPVTTAANAMAGVLNAYKANDTAKAQQEYTQWKAAHDAMGKVADLEIKSYEEDLKMSDPKRRLASLQADAAAFKNEAIMEHLRRGDEAGAEALVAGGRRALDKANGASGEFEGIHAEKVAVGEVADGKIADKEQELGRKLTKAEKAQIYLDAEAEHEAAKSGAKKEATEAATPPKPDKWQLLTDTDGTQYLQTVGADGKPKNQTLTGEPYTPTGAAKIATAENPDVAKRKDADEARKQAADAERARHDDMMAKISADRTLDESQRAAAVLAERTRHDKAMEAANKANGASGEFEGIHAENTAIGEIADEKIAEQQSLTGKPLTKGQKAQIYLDARADYEAKKVGGTAAARFNANPANQPLDDDSIRDAVKEFRDTGKMPALGMGSSIIRKQILTERSRELREEAGSVAQDITRQSDIHSLQQALTILERSHANVANFEGTALKEADLTLQKAERGAAVGGVPMANRWIQAGRTSIAGDPDVAAFNAAMVSFKNEYARIMSSPTATGGQTSDAARAEADTLINGAMTKGALVSVIDTMKQGMRNRIDTINDELKATQDRIAELASQPGKPAAPATGGWTVTRVQ